MPFQSAPQPALTPRLRLVVSSGNVEMPSDEDAVAFAVDAKPKTTQQLQRLRNIEHDPRVSLLADAYADDWSTLW